MNIAKPLKNRPKKKKNNNKDKNIIFVTSDK